MILLIDNYDSFTFNLYQIISKYEDVRVIRNDDILLQGNLTEYSKIIISPGPGTPKSAGMCLDIIKEYGDSLPILGICLGHQCIVEACGGKVIRAQKQKHGKTSKVITTQLGLFRDLPTEFTVMRYHSLIADKESLPECLSITAISMDDGEIMAIQHQTKRIYGIQFHPESFLTEHGEVMLRHFIKGGSGNEGSFGEISNTSCINRTRKL